MALATIDSHSLKVQNKLYKIPASLVLIRLFLNEMQPFENVKIYKEMYGHPAAIRHSVRMAIHFFVDFDVFKSLYLSQNNPDQYQT